MKVLIQRVSHAQVKVSDKIVGKTEKGLLLLIGIDKTDNQDTVQKMTNKVLNYRIFPDKEGKMNLSVNDIQGGILAISQFTLSANTQKGLRPSFSSAAAPALAQNLYEDFVARLKQSALTVKTGIFAADMQVSLCNDGPVTFMLEID